MPTVYVFMIMYVHCICDCVCVILGENVKIYGSIIIIMFAQSEPNKSMIEWVRDYTCVCVSVFDVGEHVCVCVCVVYVERRH